MLLYKVSTPWGITEAARTPHVYVMHGHYCTVIGCMATQVNCGETANRLYGHACKLWRNGSDGGDICRNIDKTFIIV